MLAEVPGEGRGLEPVVLDQRPAAGGGDVARTRARVRVATIRDDGSASEKRFHARIWPVGTSHLSPDGTVPGRGLRRPSGGGHRRRAHRRGASPARRRPPSWTRAHGRPSGANSAEFSPDGRWVAVAHRRGRASGSTTPPPARPRPHACSDAAEQRLALAWSPDSRRLAASEEQGDIRVYDGRARPARSDRRALRGAGQRRRRRAGVLARRHPAARRRPGRHRGALVWDVSAAGAAEVRNVRGAAGDAAGVAFGPDGRLFTVGEGASSSSTTPTPAVARPATAGPPRALTRVRSEPFRALSRAVRTAGAVGHRRSHRRAHGRGTSPPRTSLASPSTSGFRQRPAFSPDGRHRRGGQRERDPTLRRRDGEIRARLGAGGRSRLRRPGVQPRRQRRGRAALPPRPRTRGGLGRRVVGLAGRRGHARHPR